MTEKIICFSRGLPVDEIEKGKRSFQERNQDAPVLDVITVTDSMLDSRVGDVLEGVLAGSLNDRVVMPPKEKKPSSAIPDRYRIVTVFCMEQEQVLQVMRSFKAVLPDPQNLIFAVITPTALTWTFGYYIEHLAEEHESRMGQH